MLFAKIHAFKMLWIFSGPDLETVVDMIIKNNNTNRRWIRKMYRDEYLEVRNLSLFIMFSCGQNSRATKWKWAYNMTLLGQIECNTMNIMSRTDSGIRIIFCSSSFNFISAIKVNFCFNRVFDWAPIEDDCTNHLRKF